MILYISSFVSFFLSSIRTWSSDKLMHPIYNKVNLVVCVRALRVCA